MQGIVVLNGTHSSTFDVKRDSKVEELIEKEYLVDRTDEKDIIEKHYNRNDLFMELSKRQYDIQPNTGTTKGEMIEWIITNSDSLKNKLAGKYITVCYSDSFIEFVKPLKDLLGKLDARHPYRAERILLTDFYYEMQEEEKSEKREIETLAGNFIQRQENSKKNKKVALILCVAGGYIGLHQFYAGKAGTGILYLCTVGLFGIGWIADIVRIATGKFKDKDGYIIK